MLKALELIGFKSFADKTRLDFHSGVTCVVGPNGSGKSNVVDAIKWVTGSQSAKSLRGKEMTDVIFNGSAGRRAMNSAEVTLEFDNSADLFDIKSPTVRFTRRVYRSGEAEYLVNGSAARLRDIRSLLAGTGIGAESYSIIEQGRVDALLRASPKDRRVIFEEAAGVSRFRLKKHEAAKRLARVEQNLLRLSDIVDEVEGRLRKVKKQAGRAQKYRESSERLKELRTQIGLTDWRSLAVRSSRLRDEVERLSSTLEADAATLAEAEEELQRLEKQGSRVGQHLADADHQLANIREKIGGARARSQSEQSRVIELGEELRLKRGQLLGAMSQQDPHSGPREKDHKAELELARRELTETTSKLHEALSRLSDQEAEHGRCMARLEEVKRGESAAGEQLEQLGQRRKSLRDAIENNKRKLAEAQEAWAQSEEQCETLEAACEQAKLDALEKRNRVEESVSLLAAQQAQCSNLRASMEDLRKRLVQDEARLLSLRHEVAAIERLETDLEAGRHELASRRQPDSDWDVVGVVADLLQVDYETAPLVEAALGARAHHLVIDSGQNLLQALAAGAEAPERRASLERLDFQAPASVVDHLDLAGQPGVMGRADQHVECEPEHASLVRRLLGRVWFVDTLTTAQRLSTGEGRGLTFVTYKGEVLTADGLLTIGSKGDAQGVLTRRSRAQELRDEQRTLEAEVEELRTSIASLELQLTEGEHRLQLVVEQRSQSADANAEARHGAKRAEERLAEYGLEQEKLRGGLTQLQKQLESDDASLAALQSGFEQSEQEFRKTSNRRAESEQAVDDLANALSEIRDVVVSCQVNQARAEQRAEVLDAHVRHGQHADTHRRQELQDAQGGVQACSMRLTEHELLLLRAQAELSELHVALQQLVQLRRQLSKEAGRDAMRRGQIAQAARQRRQSYDGMAAERQRLEIELTQATLDQTALADRLRDDYGIDLATAAEQSDAASEISDRRAMEREIASLREDVHSVGAVNLESIEELDDLQSRFDELSSQYQDLSDAKSSLERLTQRLNIETRKLFLATIESVRGEFRELFRQLFGGGEADLLLVDGDESDPLDAGVEIAAQPPGKDLSSLSLLSGGEKTMTCVALLLALFRTKPSPFCVLDEVDAALDEANIGRFTGVLSEFLSSTQFIVITHSKKTMTDADTMYGITMQESGVSKQVAVRFEEVDEQGNIRPNDIMRTEKRSRAA